jgi:hypothetical protein
MQLMAPRRLASSLPLRAPLGAVAACAFTLALGSAGCRKPAAAPPDELALPAAIGDVTLPTARSTARPAAGLRVYLGRKTLSVGAPPRVIATLPAGPGDAGPGFDASLKRSGPNDLLLVPLQAAIPKGTASALVYLDRDAPYRALTEVLFTLGNAEVTQLDLMTLRGPDTLGSLRLTLPRADCMLQLQAETMQADLLSALGTLGDGGLEPLPGAAPSAPSAPRLAAASAAPAPPAAKAPWTKPSNPCPSRDGPRLEPTVIILQAGFAVKARAGNVAPGCNDPGPGLTVPTTGGRQDFAALTACLAKLKGLSPDFADEQAITISANPGVTAQVVISTIEAAAGGGDAGLLFPKASLGVAR